MMVHIDNRVYTHCDKSHFGTHRADYRLDEYVGHDFPPIASSRKRFVVAVQLPLASVHPAVQ